MKSKASLVINAKAILATPGELILDAAMAAGIAIPHDCSSGQCDTCRVRVYQGSVDPQGTQRGDTVLACQAKITGDAVIEFDAVPDLTKIIGRLSSIKPLSTEIFELTVTLPLNFIYLPGQYVKCTFTGFPARDYSPTQRADGSGELNEVIFHVRRYSEGAVSAHLGGRIDVNHLVTISGPFGSAFHRQGEGRIVLVATGTGWAPIWAIARASRYRQPDREMIVIVGSRVAENLHMAESLQWLRTTGVNAAFAVVSGPIQQGATPLLSGRVTDHLPKLHMTDAVYAAGNPAMVADVQKLCELVEAKCYADPFTASQTAISLGQRLKSLFSFNSSKVANSVAPGATT